MLLPVSALEFLNCDTISNDNDDVTERSDAASGEVEEEADKEGNEAEQEEALFDPPLYRQRYSAVAKIINEHSAKFVIDMGCSEGQFISKVKDMCPTVERIVGVDVDLHTLEFNSRRLKPLTIEYILKRDTPLTLSLHNGSISEPDLRFHGADVIACIEVIEHLYKETLDKVPNSIFGVLQPKVVVITTPNCEYNVLFKNFSGMRHYDHKFEWNRKEFETWCTDIVDKYPYSLQISGVGDPPSEHNDVGYCSQMAVFVCQVVETETSIINDVPCCQELSTKISSNSSSDILNNTCSSVYKLVTEVVYPFDDKLKNVDQRILNETEYIINHFFSDISEETEEIFTKEISVKELLSFPGLKKFKIMEEDFLELLKQKYSLSPDQTNLLVEMKLSDFMRDSWYGDGSDDDFDLDGEISSGNVQVCDDDLEFELWD